MPKDSLLDPDATPSTLSIKQKSRNNAGIKRLNRKPLMAIFGTLTVVLVILIYALSQRGKVSSGPTESTETARGNPNTADSVLALAPQGGVIEAAAPPEPLELPSTTTSNVGSLRATSASNRGSGGQKLTLETANTGFEPERKLSKQEQRLQEDEFQRMMLKRRTLERALEADTQSSNNGFGAAESGTNPTANSSPFGQLPFDPSNPNGDPTADIMSSLMGALGSQANAQQSNPLSSLGGLFGDSGGYKDNTNQAGKQAFLNSEPEQNWYLNSQRRKPLVPYELKTGSMIPGIMISGINSDLPGNIIAQVSQNVFDTATGEHLLIPLGTKLYGSYDSQIAYGQSRVLIRWERLIFPDASTVNLEGMQGMDTEGYAGFEDKVNNHYLRLFGGATLLSLISAGAQLAIPEGDDDGGQGGLIGSPSGLSASEQIQLETSQQYSSLGRELIERNLDIPPTIEIRPGYRFSIMVNKDMIIEPYKAM